MALVRNMIWISLHAFGAQRASALMSHFVALRVSTLVAFQKQDAVKRLKAESTKRL